MVWKNCLSYLYHIDTCNEKYIPEWTIYIYIHTYSLLYTHSIKILTIKTIHMFIMYYLEHFVREFDGVSIDVTGKLRTTALDWPLGCFQLPGGNLQLVITCVLWWSLNKTPQLTGNRFKLRQVIIGIQKIRGQLNRLKLSNANLLLCFEKLSSMLNNITILYKKIGNEKCIRNGATKRKELARYIFTNNTCSLDCFTISKDAAIFGAMPSPFARASTLNHGLI